MVGPNFRVGKKIGCGNFGELRLGVYYWNLKHAVLFSIVNVHVNISNQSMSYNQNCYAVFGFFLKLMIFIWFLIMLMNPEFDIWQKLADSVIMYVYFVVVDLYFLLKLW